MVHAKTAVLTQLHSVCIYLRAYVCTHMYIYTHAYVHRYIYTHAYVHSSWYVQARIIAGSKSKIILSK